MAWRRRYPFDWMWRDLDEMMNDLEKRFSDLSGSRVLPPGGFTERMLPAIRGEFRVDVRDHEDEVLVVADLPGCEKENVSLHLINSRTLEIGCERKAEQEEVEEGYYMRERLFGSMSRVVSLPNDVTDEGATIVVNYVYRAFGEQLKRLDANGGETGDEAKYSYGGKELDDGTNLYYFNARYYDAAIGRFINVDPIQDGSNWYVYCSNNPLAMVDPTDYLTQEKDEL